MHRSSVVAVLFAFLISAWGWAQAPGSVSGIVLEPSHARLARAVVRLFSAEGVEIGRMLTDQQGRFSFQQACETGCFVEVQLSGFQSKKLRTPLKQQEVELSLAPVRENVVVTASRTETPTSQVGSTVTTIAQEEISERQKLMVSDLLQSIPGVTV